MLEKKELKQITWIDKNHQLADSLTKSGSSSEHLLNTFILFTNILTELIK